MSDVSTFGYHAGIKANSGTEGVNSALSKPLSAPVSTLKTGDRSWSLSNCSLRTAVSVSNAKLFEGLGGDPVRTLNDLHSSRDVQLVSL